MELRSWLINSGPAATATVATTATIQAPKPPIVAIVAVVAVAMCILSSLLTGKIKSIQPGGGNGLA